MDRELETAARRLITGHEGRRKHVYPDSLGHPTIGVGMNLDRDDSAARLARLSISLAEVKEGRQDLTDDEIDLLFEEDFRGAVNVARALVKNLEELPAAVQQVLIDMSFQMGATRLGKFKRMLAAVYRQDWRRMILEIRNSEYATQVPARLEQNVGLIETTVAGAEPEGIA